jgi:simple sugar transport system permease protein
VLNKLLTGLAGVFIALLLGAGLMRLEGYDPLATYGALFEFSLGDAESLATTLKNAIPLILTGLSAAVAFASGPVNLGQPGQLGMGALFATLGGIYLDAPAPVLIPLLIALALLGGAFWSGLAALLRRAFHMSEFISTLMLNFIADLLIVYLISEPLMDPAAFSPMTRRIAAAGELPLVTVPGLGAFSSGLIVLALAFGAIWFVFSRWTQGYEWRLTGQNALFARLGGVKIEDNYVTVMLATGALAGLAGGLLVMAGPGRFVRGLGANYAWDGIMIAVVANSGLIATVLYGLFFAALQTGALGMELITAVPSEFILVVQALTVLIVVASRGRLSAWLEVLAAQRKLRKPQPGPAGAPAP